MGVGVGGVARFPPLPAVPAGERRGGWGSDGAAAAPASVLLLLAVAELDGVRPPRDVVQQPLVLGRRRLLDVAELAHRLASRSAICAWRASMVSKLTSG